jgi:hypothetical protein
MSIETPSNEELGQRMKTQLAVASEVLGFDVGNSKEQTPEHDALFLQWINENGAFFKDVLDQNPDIWERVCKGGARPQDIHWIREQLALYDTGAENHEDGREPDA